MALLFIIGAVLLYLLSRQGGSNSAAPQQTGTGTASGAGTSTGATGSGTAIASYGLDRIAHAVAYIESGGRQTDSQGNIITSSAGALGIMQLMPSTAADLGVDPYDAQQNFAGGETYLQQLYSKYGDWDTALAAYNWGPGHVDSALASGSPFPQSVQDYVDSVDSQLE